MKICISNKPVWMFGFIIILLSCGVNNEEINKAKTEILYTEYEFARMVKNEGIDSAFYHYADEQAVINRGRNIIKGKDKIKAYYQNQPLTDIQLSWSPVFVDVASSGDLGYTYGIFTFAAKDSTGKQVRLEGIFHTVWKKQDDDNWRFVWD
jgi:ketosteroid isomerase-like protein